MIYRFRVEFYYADVKDPKNNDSLVLTTHQTAWSNALKWANKVKAELGGEHDIYELISIKNEKEYLGGGE